MILGGFDRGFHGSSVHRFAVMEFYIRAQVEGPNRAIRIGFPAFGQQWRVLLSRAGWVDAEQLLVDVRHISGFGGEGSDGIPCSNVGGIGDL